MKVIFDIPRGQISIEGDSPDLVSVLQIVRDLAPKLTEIRLITGPAQLKPPAAGTVPPGKPEEEGKEIIPPKGSVPTLRDFVKLVSPETVADRIITVGVYHARYYGQDSFTPKQMAEWFTHSGFQKPAQMPVALFAAKKRYGYLENPAHGKWKVSITGENAVTSKIEEKGGSA